MVRAKRRARRELSRDMELPQGEEEMMGLP